MEMGEKIAVGGLQKEVKEKCPFCDDVKGVDNKDNEDIGDDDLDDVQELQDNDGGTLGKNLCNASNGENGTWQGAPFPPPDAEGAPPNDSHRKNGKKVGKAWVNVRVPGTGAIKTGNYPFTVAAHHLIPGNASLYTDECNLKNYMIQGQSVEAEGSQWKIKYHIGYNVNGAHNGVWLAGNYAIRSKTSPTGVSWGDMGHEDWQLRYVAACVQATGGRQFHDAHTQYSDAVRDLLNKIAERLSFHQAHCDLCQENGDKEVTPPYLIKQRLYSLSKYFRDQLAGSPSTWRRPWFTSDRWREVVFPNEAVSPSSEFLEAYGKAGLVESEET